MLSYEASFLWSKKRSGKGYGPRAAAAIATARKNAASSCLELCRRRRVFFHLFYSTLLVLEASRLGEKKRGRAILTATNARGAFFQSSSVRLGHQKKSPDWQRQRRWYYTQLEAFHLLSFMVPPPFRPMARQGTSKRVIHSSWDMMYFYLVMTS